MRTPAVLAPGLTLALASAALGQATFSGIGDLAGGAHASMALGLSPDGARIVGLGTTAAGTRAVLWSAGTLSALSDPAGVYTLRDAHAVSGNGVITGSADGPSGAEAYKYNISGGNRFRALGGAGFTGSVGRSVSSNGGTVVGRRENPDGSLEAARWDGPILSGLGYLDPDFRSSIALGISADGLTIVGSADGPEGVRAFVFAGGSMSMLDAPGATQSEAYACSGSGAVIVGTAAVNGATNRAARWTNGAFADLGDLPGGPDNSGALACSADGSVIGGYAYDNAGSHAVVWRSGQLTDVKAMLLGAGLTTLNAWQLSAVTGVSADGLTVCGYGTGPSGSEGWVAHLPPPAPPCRVDFNGDGFVDFFDYDDYVNCFETGSCPPGTTADFNGDAFVDFFDYDDFVAAFQAGC